MLPMDSLLDFTHAGLAVTVILLSWTIYKSIYKRSPFDNIPGPTTPGKWTTGHFRNLFDRQKGWDFFHEVGTEYQQVVRLDDMFGGKMLYVFDPVALHSIVVKDQHIFEETAGFLAANKLAFGNGLLATIGEHHRKQRKLLNPVFSINHMRHMLPIFYEVSGRLRTALTAQVAAGPQTTNMLSWMTRAALEMVGQGGLGYPLDPLTDDTQNPFSDAMKSLGPTMFPMVLLRALLPQLMKLGPPRFRRLLVEWTPYWRIRKTKEIVDTMHAVSCQIFEAKKRVLEKGEDAVVQQIGEGKDIISKLLQANMVASEEDRLPDDEVIAQMATLVFAAMDTTSGALAHILHLLAENQDVQDRLRTEITNARQANGGRDLSYDELSELPYLEAVCRETLRMYPPLLALSRTARSDAVLPLGTPIRGLDGTLINEILVPKKSKVVVGIMASNRNPALWGPDANEWKPERWLGPLPETISKARVPGIYSNLMTFLGGGRACIGFKFSQMEMKVILFTLLEVFKFSIPTDLNEPIVWNVAGIQYPSVGYGSSKAELPLKVELLQK